MANQQRDSKPFDPILLVGIVGVVMILGYVIWYLFHTQISTAYAWLRMSEFFVFWAIGELFDWLRTPFHGWFDFFQGSDKSMIRWGHIAKSTMLANIFTFVIIVPYAIWIARKSIKTNPYNHKNFGKIRDYTLHTFTDHMGQYYPHLRLFRKINLVKRSVKEGKYRMSDNEKEFAIKHKVLDRLGQTDTFKVNRDRAIEVFRAQMGSLWTSEGYRALTVAEYAVIAALVPRIAATDDKMEEGEYKAALKSTTNILKNYWEVAADTYNHDTDTCTLDLTLAHSAIKKYGKHPKVVQLIQRHAYVYTIIYDMLETARKLGVLQASEFRWLRVLDRRLWLVIDNIGRQKAFTEVAGIYSHYLSEKKQRRALEKPYLEAAAKALIEGVDEYKFTDDEIEQINSILNSQVGDILVESEALKPAEKTFYLATVNLQDGKTREVFEACILDEAGQVILHKRAKTTLPITQDIKDDLGLSDQDLVALLESDCTSQDLLQMILAKVNGHHLVTFNPEAIAAIPAIDRSASKITICTGIMGGIYESVYDASAELGLGLIPPRPCKVDDEAMCCRQVWVALQKRALAAQLKS